MSITNQAESKFMTQRSNCEYAVKGALLHVHRLGKKLTTNAEAQKKLTRFDH